jgi:ABC-type nitrate/sulfonate/bicarbonate transport system substrate-binding protein
MKTSIVTAALILCVTVTSGWSQTRQKLHVIYPAISGINAPLWYATEQNLFPKYGLDVELIYIPTALQATRVVLTGDSEIAFSGGAPVVSAVLGGADLVFIGGVANVCNPVSQLSLNSVSQLSPEVVSRFAEEGVYMQDKEKRMLEKKSCSGGFGKGDQ